jgi:sec-independent protein translocase protein TatA
MPNVGGPEIIVVLLVALIVLGPQRLPEVGRQIGNALRELRKVQSDVKAQIDDAMRVESPSSTPPAITSEPAVPGEQWRGEPAVPGEQWRGEPAVPGEQRTHEPVVSEPAAAHDAPPAATVDGDADQLPPPTSFI